MFCNLPFFEDWVVLNCISLISTCLFFYTHKTTSMHEQNFLLFNLLLALLLFWWPPFQPLPVTSVVTKHHSLSYIKHCVAHIRVRVKLENLQADDFDVSLWSLKHEPPARIGWQWDLVQKMMWIRIWTRQNIQYLKFSSSKIYTSTGYLIRRESHKNVCTKAVVHIIPTLITLKKLTTN